MSWTEIILVIVALLAVAVGFFVTMKRAHRNYTACPGCGKTIFKGMRKCMHCGAVNDGGDPPNLVRPEEHPGE